MTSERFTQLSDRQREYLRYVFQHKKSGEIAYLTGALLAKDIIGATSRFEAARLFAEHEAGVEEFYPASVAPSRRPFWPLPMPVPTKGEPTNTLTWKQVLAWGAIIAIVAPAGITLAATVIIALTLLLGINPR
jgi:hypothetical protein